MQHSEGQKNRKIEILTVGRMTNEKFVNLYEMRYRDKIGREKTWSYASRSDPPKAETGRFDAPDAVVIVAFHETSGRLVIIKEFRIPLAGWLYGFPAGLVDEGESLEGCAERELFEETGLVLTRVHRVSPPIYSSSGLTDESVAMVYADCVGTPSDHAAGSAEDIEAVFVSAADARELCARRDIAFDVKTWLVLEAFGVSGKI
ncbi:MAG: NUDIX hydrolase [Desulfosalsimonadaceae bacterium]